MAGLGFNTETGSLVIGEESAETRKLHHNKYHQNKTENPRKKIVEISSRIIELLHETAFDPLRPMSESQTQAVTLLMPMILDIVKDSKTLSKNLNLRGKNISSQIDEILVSVSDGSLSLPEAKEYLGMISEGYQLTEIPKLLQKMEAIENGNT